MEERKSWLMAFAGAAVGFIAASIYFNSKPSSSSEPETEVVGNPNMRMVKASTFTREKAARLHNAESKFSGGLGSELDTPVFRIPHLEEIKD